MAKMIFASLPVTDLPASIAFYRALGFEQNSQFSAASGACMAAMPPSDSQGSAS